MVKKRELFDDLVKNRRRLPIKTPENEEVKNGDQYYEENQDDIEILRVIPGIEHPKEF